MSLDKVSIAAHEGLEIIQSCYVLISKMELQDSQRRMVAVGLLYSSLEQGRAACYLIANDPEHATFAAIILFRSQLEQLIRAQFFAGPASDEQVQHFLDHDTLPQHDGQNLGPKSLSKINTAHFGWGSDKLIDVVLAQWEPLSSAAHGGRAVLDFYIGPDGVGPAKVTEEFIEPLANIVVLAQLCVSLAMSMATNQAEEDFQKSAKEWYEGAHAYFAKWAPKIEDASGA